MPAISASEMVAAIQEAYSRSGASAIISSGIRAHPRRFHVVSGVSSFPVWIYIWTLTHGGGRARPQDEYRIQLTSVRPPLPMNPDGPTLLLGYEPDLECFAGFDLAKHHAFSTQSPSIQVNINVLRDAMRDGFAFATKGNEEIAVGFRPDNILAYSMYCEALHESGRDDVVTDILARVSRFEEVADSEIQAVPEERRRVITQFARLSRDSNFRRKVTVAYDRKCCITGLQLNLVDAAHILPVGAEGSTDEVSNGLCLSPTYHRAFDQGLIVLTEDLRMCINQDRRDELLKLGLGGGLKGFETHLDREILLPADRQQWPEKHFVRSAYEYRRA